MRLSRFKVTVFLAVAIGFLAVLPGADAQETDKASLELAADRTSYAPGSAARIAAIIDIVDGWHINSHTPSQEFLIATELTLDLPEGWPQPKLTYPAHQMMQVGDLPTAVYDGKVTILAELEVPAGENGTIPIEADLWYQACDDKSCVAPTHAYASLELLVGEEGEERHAEIFAGAATGSPAHPASRDAGLPFILMAAVLGGLILNAMPCVLPVLSLKVFSLVKSASHGRAALVAGSLATTAGILASFLALAAVAVFVRASGAAVGWGVQFQQPLFVTFLLILVVLFCLNLWDVFEIQMPHQLMNAAGRTQQEGLSGHFFTGLFATLMATPCSAPFLGTAVGFALAQPAWKIFMVFAAIGVGLALPYLLLAAFPGSARWLPKPGEWMVTLKGAMGFLLLAAAIWLCFVLAGQIGAVQLAFIQLAILGLSLVVWLTTRATTGSGARRLGWAAAFALCLATLGLAARSEAVGGTQIGSSQHIAWQAFDRETAIRLAADEGRLVFVDVTADWCLTCKVNEATVLETREIADAFERFGVVPMKADWTNRNPTIADYLAQYGRSAIPFYILYRPGRDPHIFGTVLRKGNVLKTLEESASRAQTAGLDLD